MKKAISLVLAAALFFTCCPALAAQTAYADVPEDSWAAQSIFKAAEYGLMEGVGDGKFGYGQTISKAEFVAILCRMMGWNTVTPQPPSFSDVAAKEWYYGAVETALANGVMEKSNQFSPTGAITREEMSVMLVKALGLSAATTVAQKRSMPFTDVTNNRGYVAIAYQIGMTTGTTATTFSPGGNATREEAAAMLTRIYASYFAQQTDFLHGFYAISSYNQKELAAQMDAVTYLWGTMTVGATGAALDTTGQSGGDYKLPNGYDSITSYLDNAQKPQYFGVHMSKNVKELVTNAAYRTQAVQAILAEVTKTYAAIGKNPYSGVTVNFEGLRGSDTAQGFNAFLQELSAELKKINKGLYVTVQPVTADGAYFDGFDYAAIGKVADKVILMAHDYAPTNMDNMVGTEWQKNAPLTPISAIYYALLAATDPNTGVQDTNKLLLAISIDAVGWEVDGNGKLTSGAPLSANAEAVSKRLAQADAKKGFSQQYRNPYVEYQSETGKHIFLWYEDSKSIFEKAALARLFGVSQLSVWRIGNIPNSENYSVMDSFR